MPTLIIVYAMLILGGAGSLGGVILGALVVNVSLEVLRTPGHATWIFYVVLLATLLAKVRPWRWLAIVVGGTIGFGYAVHAIASVDLADERRRSDVGRRRARQLPPGLGPASDEPKNGRELSPSSCSCSRFSGSRCSTAGSAGSR